MPRTFSIAIVLVEAVVNGQRVFQDMQPGPMGGRPSGSRLRLQNETLARLICYSYSVKPWQVVEGPAWAAVPRGGKPINAQTRFEIVARAEGESPRPIEDFRAMMQSLLADRFHLVMHRDTRPVRVYALTLDKGGLKRWPENEAQPTKPKGRCHHQHATPPACPRMGALSTFS
jgi:uncharacterized protein (TIGR03435 family)